LNTEILTYSRSRGLFAGITLDGAVVEQDNDSTRAIYGRDRAFRSILSGEVAPPDSLPISISVKEPKGEYDMPLVQVVITLIVIGVLLGLVNRFIPMQSSIKSILNGIVVIGVVLWIVNLFGLFTSISKIHIGR
jgi:hypothetical protein